MKKIYFNTYSVAGKITLFFFLITNSSWLQSQSCTVFFSEPSGGSASVTGEIILDEIVDLGCVGCPPGDPANPCDYTFTMTIYNGNPYSVNLYFDTGNPVNSLNEDFDQFTDYGRTRTITAPCAGVDGTVTITVEPDIAMPLGSCNFPLTASLPVELVTFSGSPKANGQVALQWSTLSEINNEGFEIQRSFDAKDWEYVAFINGRGDSQDYVEYNFWDKAPGNVGSYYYRLKQIDFDGAFSYSQVIHVSMETDSRRKLKIYPNPVRQYMNLTSPAGKATVYNALGQPIRTLKVVEGSTSWNIGDLQSGIYTLQIFTEKGRYYKEVFVKGE